uniref:Uncharacterized protein n=1 Tax=Arundo donax TaxID=35708 RepID=A0A0A9FMY2_ARUDO
MSQITKITNQYQSPYVTACIITYYNSSCFTAKPLMYPHNLIRNSYSYHLMDT